MIDRIRYCKILGQVAAVTAYEFRRNCDIPRSTIWTNRHDIIIKHLVPSFLSHYTQLAKPSQCFVMSNHFRKMAPAVGIEPTTN